MKNLLAKIAFSLGLMASTVLAQAQNIGFELGNTTGWTVSGADVTTSTGLINASYGGGKTWTIRPYGTHMAVLYPSGGIQFDGAVSSLGLTAADNTAIRNFMAANAGGGNPTPTNASWIKRTVTLTAGVTYTFAWNYLSTDYTPFNDGSMVTLVHTSDPTKIPTLNNEVKRYALLGFTNPGTGNYSTDSYGSTGWQLAVFTVPETGAYELGFATFNLGDTALSPMLFIDELQGTTELNGQPFAPIAPNPGSSAPVTGGGGSEPTYVSDITPEQQALMDAAKARTNAVAAGNRIMLEIKSGSNSNLVTIEQSGASNLIQGLGGTQYAIIQGNSNIVNIKQGDAVGKNLIELGVTGSSNNLTLHQARNAAGDRDGSESGGHYLGLSVTGSSNTVVLRQGNDGGANSGHFANYSLAGNSNNTTLQQRNNGGKMAFVTVSGSNNIFDVLQQGTGLHYLDLSLTGNGHNATIQQRDSGTHKATISLTNAGGSSTLNLIQQGATNQVYNITQQCANLQGCSVSVTQGTGP